jgi:hypothetical protein
MNVRLEALHQKADNLDGELETARETDAMIEAVMTEKRQKQRIAMLDDLAGVEQLVRILPTCMPESDDHILMMSADASERMGLGFRV